MKKLISLLLVAMIAISLFAVAATAEEEAENWAYAGITLEGMGTVWYARDYFAIEGIVNPQTAEPYTEEELTAIVEGAADDNESYRFDVPADALLGFAASEEAVFWYDADNTAAITGHADPLSIDENGIFATAEGEVVAEAIK